MSPLLCVILSMNGELLQSKSGNMSCQQPVIVLLLYHVMICMVCHDLTRNDAMCHGMTVHFMGMQPFASSLGNIQQPPVVVS